MIDLKRTQKDIFQNKLNKGFNTTNVDKEFCCIYGELGEAYEAYTKNKDDLGEEIADVVIYLMAISEMLGFNLEDEIIKKVEKNKKRKYKKINGVNTRIEG